MSVNIKYDRSRTESGIASVDSLVTGSLEPQKGEYEALIAAFASSDCEHVKAMQAQLKQEVIMLEETVRMFLEFTKVLRKASEDLTDVETNFATEHIN